MLSWGGGAWHSRPERANLKSQIVISSQAERIERSILLIRGHKVMLDADLSKRADRPGVLDMWATCSYAVRMSKMIQLRHVPDELHRKLKARAALEGLSLSDYLLKEVQRAAERPTLAELRQRLARRTPVATRVPPAKAVRAERGRG